jgi:hypothetical protein
MRAALHRGFVLACAILAAALAAGCLAPRPR